MSPETWSNISTIALIAGFAFLALTVVLAVKFDLIMIIKAELNSKKAEKLTDGEDYFAYVENRSSAMNDDAPRAVTVSRESEPLPQEIADSLRREQQDIRVVPIAESGLVTPDLPTGCRVGDRSLDASVYEPDRNRTDTVMVGRPNISEPVSEKQPEKTGTETVLTTRQPVSSSTIPTSRSIPSPSAATEIRGVTAPTEQASVTVIKGMPVMTAEPAAEDEFVVIENIILIHGDPSSVPRSRSY